MRVTDQHTFFFTKYDVFSNWYIAPFTYKGKTFNCNEQFMMYCKARLFKDLDIAQKILNTPSQKEQKDLGREVKGYVDQLWQQNCQNYVYIGAREKFTQHERLYNALLATHPTTLVEASPYDKIWGIGMSQSAPGVDDPNNWKGENRLGNILTKLRNDLILLPKPSFGEHHDRHPSP